MTPGRPGDVYDTAALTEDNEITIALKTLGALMVSPRDCTVVTELMPTWADLWLQRLRWQRGAVENIGAYGLTARLPLLAPAARHRLRHDRAERLLACMAILWRVRHLGVVPVLAGGRLGLRPRAGRHRVGGGLAARCRGPLVPELLYDLFLDAVFVHGLVQITLARRAQWGHERAETHPLAQVRT